MMSSSLPQCPDRIMLQASHLLSDRGWSFMGGFGYCFQPIKLTLFLLLSWPLLWGEHWVDPLSRHPEQMPFLSLPSYPKLICLGCWRREQTWYPLDHLPYLCWFVAPFPSIPITWWCYILPCKSHFGTLARVKQRVGAISSPATSFLILLEGRTWERYKEVGWDWWGLGGIGPV